jgi:hypothetical protein
MHIRFDNLIYASVEKTLGKYDGAPKCQMLYLTHDFA